MPKEFFRKFLPEKLLNFYHLLLNFLGALYYGFPSRKLKVIGVTGTNGKTTVVNLIYEILKTAGFKVAAFSSLDFKIGEVSQKNTLKMTMPGRWYLQKLLKRAQKEGCQYAIVEVTSEGIKQNRHRFIKFDTAILTNLRPEHIEAHGSFEKYRQAKAELFKITKKTHILNLDDENFEYFSKFPASQKYGYQIEIPNSKLKIEASKYKIIQAKDIKLQENYSSFKIQNIQFHLPLPGLFNVYNALSAISSCLVENISLKLMAEALKNIKGVPGRMEVIQEKPFKVVVDYAHTPDALESVYQTLLENPTNKNLKTRLICVFGSAGGGRDKWKRPEMGKIAAKYCQYIILTNEDPYDENPKEILDQIEQGIKKAEQFKPNLLKILDRKEAIKKAIQLANSGDVVIITGKGAEPWMCLAKGQKLPWDDREIAKKALEYAKIELD